MEIPKSGYIIMASTVVIKSFVWVAYRSFQNSSVKALAQDAQNDVVFNLFSILFPFAGTLIGWPILDPLGGVILSLYSVFEKSSCLLVSDCAAVIIDWSQTLYQNVVNLAGRRASAAAHQRVRRVSTSLHQLILRDRSSTLSPASVR